MDASQARLKNRITVFDVISKEDGKDKEKIQSSSTPDPGYHMGK